MCHHDYAACDQPELHAAALMGHVALMLAPQFVKAHFQKRVCCVGSRSACLLPGLP